MKTLSKKIISLFLTLTMVFSLSTTAFAAEPVQTIVTDDSRSFTVLSSTETNYGKVVTKATEIYKTNYHGEAIIYIKDGLGVITRTDGTFVSGWKLSSEQIRFHRSQVKIK